MTCRLERRRARGMTLIQILIGMATGVSVVAALSVYFVQGSRSSREDINVSNMLNELSFATGQLTADLEMTGFWAEVHDPSAITADGTLAISGTDCGPAGWYRSLGAIQLLDNSTAPTAAQIHATFPCIPENDVMPGTDVIAVKRVLGRVAATSADPSGLQAGTLYLRRHDRFGLLFRHGGGTPSPVDTPYDDWEYAPAVYFVRRFTRTAADGVPALCRATLRSAGAAAPAFEVDCVAQGIEHLQVEIGVDTDEDGGANQFTSTPSTADLNRAVTARVYLLARSVRPDVSYTNQKSYWFSNMAQPIVPSGADAHFFRKTLSREVALRNPRGLQGVALQ
jgi:type IV pilus assembly protein PilW